jgi:hypothetical protein
MIRNGMILAATATAFLLAGCAVTTTALAPGAASVRIVRSEADVASCTAVGNVRQPPDQSVDLRNLTVGIGGDTLFVTEETKNTVGIATDYIRSGVAYRCAP